MSESDILRGYLREALDNGKENGDEEFQGWILAKNTSAIFDDLARYDALVENAVVLAEQTGTLDDFKKIVEAMILEWCGDKVN